MRHSVPRHPFPIFLNIVKPGIGWVGCGWEGGKQGNTFDKWKIICQEKSQSSQLPLTFFLSEMSVLEVKIKSAFVIEIFGQPWMIRHYSFPASFSPERVLGVCLESQWGKSNAGWPGSVAVNSEKKQTQARSGNIMQSNVWTKKRNCVMEQHKFCSPKGLLIDSVLHYWCSQGEMDSSLYYENRAIDI